MGWRASLWIVGAAACASTSAHAGAWTLPKGEALLINTTEQTRANRAFGSPGRVDFLKIESRLYGEWGLFDNLSLTAKTSYQDIIFRGVEGKSRYIGPGDLRFGARLGLWSPGRHRFSVAGDVGYQRGGEFVADGELDLEGISSEWRALYGYGWDRAFVDMQAGWTTRFGLGPDSYSFDVTGGYELTDTFKLNFAAFARTTGSDRLPGDIIESTDSLKLKATLLWQRPPKAREDENGDPLPPRQRTGYEIGWVETVAGTNHVKDGGFTVGVWRKF